MQEHEIIERIKALCDQRSWTVYRLAKESGITYSTLCTMLHKTTAPSFSTLDRICSGFGISLKEFFDTQCDSATFSQEEKEHIKRWKCLSKQNKEKAEEYIDYLIYKQRT